MHSPLSRPQAHSRPRPHTVLSPHGEDHDFCLLFFLAARGATAQATAEINPWKPSGTVYWIPSPMRLNIGYTDQTASRRRKVSSFSTGPTHWPAQRTHAGQEIPIFSRPGTSIPCGPP